MNTVAAHFQSRWGYHPCDFAFYSKLKRLHKWYRQTLAHFHRWHRWWRKKEHNRQGPEPHYCPAFVEDKPWYKPVRHREQSGFEVYPRTVVDHGVVDLYRQVRMPAPEPVAPLPEKTIRMIEELYTKVAGYFEE